MGSGGRGGKDRGRGKRGTEEEREVDGRRWYIEGTEREDRKR